MTQLARQRARRAESVLGILFHRAGSDVGQAFRHCRIDGVRERRHMLDHRGRDLRQRAAAKRPLIGEQLVEHDAEREHVGAPIDGLLADLLGRHVVRRAAGNVVAGLRVVLMGDARDAEVEHARLGAADHEDVRRLDVAVHDTLAVRVGKRVGDAAHDQRGLHRRRLPAFLTQLAQVAALQQLHRDVGVVVADAGVEHRHDVRMAQAGSGARLVEEERVERGALLGRDLEIQRLDRDQPRQQRVVRGVNRAEPAFADAVLQRIAADVADRRHRVAGLADAAGFERCGRCARQADVGVAPQRDVGHARRRRRVAVGRRKARRRLARNAHARQLSRADRAQVQEKRGFLPLVTATHQ